MSSGNGNQRRMHRDVSGRRIGAVTEEEVRLGGDCSTLFADLRALIAAGTERNMPSDQLTVLLAASDVVIEAFSGKGIEMGELYLKRRAQFRAALTEEVEGALADVRSRAR